MSKGLLKSTCFLAALFMQLNSVAQTNKNGAITFLGSVINCNNPEKMFEDLSNKRYCKKKVKKDQLVMDLIDSFFNSNDTFYQSLFLEKINLKNLKIKYKQGLPQEKRDSNVIVTQDHGDYSLPDRSNDLFINGGYYNFMVTPSYIEIRVKSYKKICSCELKGGTGEETFTNPYYVVNYLVPSLRQLKEVDLQNTTDGLYIKYL